MCCRGSAEAHFGFDTYLRIPFLRTRGYHAQEVLLVADCVFGADRGVHELLLATILALSNAATLLLLAHKPRYPTERRFFRKLAQDFDGWVLPMSPLSPQPNGACAHSSMCAQCCGSCDGRHGQTVAAAAATGNMAMQQRHRVLLRAWGLRGWTQRTPGRCANGGRSRSTGMHAARYSYG